MALLTARKELYVVTFCNQRAAFVALTLGLCLFSTALLSAAPRSPQDAASQNSTPKKPAPALPTAPAASERTFPTDAGIVSRGGLPNRAGVRGSSLAKEALTYRGVPYRMGGTSARGIDCSGLAQAVYRKWGLLLPRTSVEQFRKGRPIPKSQLQAGDLVFFKNTYKAGISHVGIYMGEGKFVHAAGRRKGVIVSSLNDKYHTAHWAGARRLAPQEFPDRDLPQPDEE